MPKIYRDILQGDGEWLKLRIGRVTASDLHRLVDSKFELRTGETPKTLLYEKAAEAIRGQPLPGFHSWVTDQGQELEDEARRWVAFHFDALHRFQRVGFVETDHGLFGCSPDALLDDDGGLELKCPQAVSHIRYLVEQRLPLEYVQQVHGSLYATGRQWWKFVSFNRNFKAFVITVQRDEEICAKIEKAVAAFAAKLQAAVAQLRTVA